MLDGTLDAPAAPSQSRDVAVKVVEPHIVQLAQLVSVPLLGRASIGGRRRSRCPRPPPPPPLAPSRRLRPGAPGGGGGPPPPPPPPLPPLSGFVGPPRPG